MRRDSSGTLWGKMQQCEENAAARLRRLMVMLQWNQFVKSQVTHSLNCVRSDWERHLFDWSQLLQGSTKWYSSVQYGTVSNFFTFPLSKEHQITCCTYSGPLSGYQASQRVQRGRSYSHCSLLTASRQKAVFKCCCRAVNVSLQ